MTRFEQREEEKDTNNEQQRKIISTFSKGTNTIFIAQALTHPIQQ